MQKMYSIKPVDPGSKLLIEKSLYTIKLMVDLSTGCHDNYASFFGALKGDSSGRF